MTRRLNLNNYTPVPKPDDSKDADLVLVPADNGDYKFPLIYYKKKKAFVKPMVVDITSAVWTPVIFISDKGIPEEYIKRVDWWFDSVDNEYKQRINDIYKNLQDLQSKLKKAKHWLLTDAAYSVNTRGVYDKRKKDINKFLRGWLNRDIDQQYRKRR